MLGAFVTITTAFVTHTAVIGSLIILGYIGGASIRIFLYAYLFAELARVPLTWLVISKESGSDFVRYLKERCAFNSRGRHWWEKEAVYKIKLMDRHNFEYTLIAIIAFLFSGACLLGAHIHVYGIAVIEPSRLLLELCVALVIGVALLGIDIGEGQIRLDTAYEVFINIDLQLRGFSYIVLTVAMFVGIAFILKPGPFLEVSLLIGLSTLRYLGDRYIRNTTLWVPRHLT